MGWVFGRDRGTQVERLRQRAMTSHDHLKVADAGRALLRLGTQEAFGAALDVVAAGRFHPWTGETPLEAELEGIAARWPTATAEGRASLARILNRTEDGRGTLRHLLGTASAPWTLRCARCDAEVMTITKVPRLWPCRDGRSSFRVDPDGAHLVLGDPAEGVALGHRSGEGATAQAFDTRDLATLAREIRWGLRSVCPEEPTVWCLDHVEVTAETQRTDLDDGWHTTVTTHTARYPDGHTRQVASRTITDA